MNGLKKIIYVLFLITTVASAQIKRIQFISDENQLPLSDVEVYDGNLLMGKSDLNGYLDIKITDSNYLYIIKEDYNNLFLKVVELQNKVILVKNKPIELEEVVIGKKIKVSVRKILNHIQDNLFDYSKIGGWVKYKELGHYNVTNKLLMETDTLHYINGLTFYNYEVMKSQINKNFRVVKNFKRDPNRYGLIYNIDKKEITFRTDWNYGEWHIDFLNLSYSLDSDYILRCNILEKRNNYHYTVTNTGNFYKVEFVSKNKSSFGFNGYLIVDKTDFGIYEFKAHLSDNIKNNDKSILLPSNTEQIYHITIIDYYTKLQKDKNGNYQLVCSYCDKQFEQTKGNFKGKKISYSSKVEATDNYKNIEFVGFSFGTYEVK